MEGLVEEGGEVIKEDMNGGIKDAALIAVRAYATRPGEDDAATLLSQTQTLQEE